VVHCVDSAPGPSHCEDVGSVADISEDHASSIFGVEVERWKQHVPPESQQHCPYPHGVKMNSCVNKIFFKNVISNSIPSYFPLNNSKKIRYLICHYLYKPCFQVFKK
jgi:hypothetical protein